MPILMIADALFFPKVSLPYCSSSALTRGTDFTQRQVFESELAHIRRKSAINEVALDQCMRVVPFGLPWENINHYDCCEQVTPQGPG